MNDRIQGQVTRVGPFARYYFLSWRNENGQILEAFGSRKSVIPDVIGRLNLRLGSSVSFVLAPDPRGKGKVAVEIQNENEDVAAIDATTWKEFGVIHTLDKAPSGQIYGVIRRGEEEGSDLIPFRASDIVSDGADTIQIGDVLEYGIGTHTGPGGAVQFHADQICTVSFDAPAIGRS
jgi:hypothetical protein